MNLVSSSKVLPDQYAMLNTPFPDRHTGIWPPVSVPDQWSIILFSTHICLVPLFWHRSHFDQCSCLCPRDPDKEGRRIKKKKKEMEKTLLFVFSPRHLSWGSQVLDGGIGRLNTVSERVCVRAPLGSTTVSSWLLKVLQWPESSIRQAGDGRRERVKERAQSRGNQRG